MKDFLTNEAVRLRKPLDAIFDNGAKVKVLRVLVSPGLELTGREVAAEAGLSVPTCARALQELVDAGLLDMTKKGRAHLYRVRNRYRLVLKGLMPLFGAERALYEQAVGLLRERFESRVVSAVLFGSHARGKEGEHSDFDVFFLVAQPEDAAKLEDVVQSAVADFHTEFGVTLAPYVQDRGEFQRMVIRRVPITLEIMKDGRLLFGKPIQRELQ